MKYRVILAPEEITFWQQAKRIWRLILGRCEVCGTDMTLPESEPPKARCHERIHCHKCGNLWGL